MNKVAEYISDMLISEKRINAESREEYIYGLEIALGKIVNYSTILLLGVLTRTLFSTVVFMFVFFTLRSRAGGFHAKSRLTCYLGTIGIYLLMVNILVPIVSRHLSIQVILLVVSFVIIFCIATVNHKNLDLTDEELKGNRKLSRRRVYLVALGAIISLLFDFERVIISSAILAMFVVAVLLVLAKVFRQEKFA